MFIATTVLSGLLAFLMAAGAVGKLTQMRTQVETAGKLMIGWSRYRLIAVPEAGAAVGLVAGLDVAGLGVAAAAGVVLLMAGALAFRLRVHDAVGFLAGDATILVLAGVTGALRLATA